MRSSQFQECCGADFLVLCERHRQGEIIIHGCKVLGVSGYHVHFSEAQAPQAQPTLWTQFILRLGRINATAGNVDAGRWLGERGRRKASGAH